MNFFSFVSARAQSRAFLSLVIAGGAAAPLAAAEAETPPLLLKQVVVEGRATDLIGAATSASQGLVGMRELEARPFLRRGELLEVIPGVVITQHSGGGKAHQYFLRGFNLDHGTDFSVSIDGMPVNMRSHGHGQGYADLNFVIPETVQRVDFSKGPFFAEVGDFSAAGAAEFRLADALPSAFAHLTLGENGFARAVFGDTVESAEAQTTYAVELSHDDGPWSQAEDFERFNLLGRRHWKSDTRDSRLTAMAYHSTWRATDQIPLRAVEAGLLGRFDTIDPTNGGESSRVSLSFDSTVNNGSAFTRVNAYAMHYRLNLFSNFTYFLDDPSEGDQFNQRDRRIVLGGAVSRTWTHGWSGKPGETTIGAQVRDDLIDELGLRRSTSRQVRANVRTDQVNESSLGLFAKNTTRWSEWLRSEAGIRVDSYYFDVESDLSVNTGRRQAAIASPKLGVVLGSWRKTEVYANAGYGFHSNDARGTTIRVDPVSGEPAERVSPLVRSRGAEVGVRTSARSGLVSSLAIWRLDLDSELVFVGDAGGTEPSGATRRYGVEWTNFYRPTEWLALDGDIAFTHARYRDAPGADRIANSISTVVSAGVAIESGQGFYGAARLRYFGPQPLIEDNSVRAPASTTVNLRAGWRQGVWDISMELLNAFDRENYDIAYFYASRLPGEAAEGIEDTHFHPAEPRTLRLTIGRRF